MREQDPDANQDRSQLENAVAVPARRVLHAQGAGRTRYAVYGPRVDSTGEIITDIERNRDLRVHRSLKISKESYRHVQTLAHDHSG